MGIIRIMKIIEGYWDYGVFAGVQMVRDAARNIPFKDHVKRPLGFPCMTNKNKDGPNSIPLGVK